MPIHMYIIAASVMNYLPIAIPRYRFLQMDRCHIHFSPIVVSVKLSEYVWVLVMLLGSCL